MADGFLGRWSRRKQDVREGKPVQEPEPLRPVPAGAGGSAAGAAPATAALVGGDVAVAGKAQPVPPAAPEAPSLPTLEDAQALSIDSDFKPFVGRAVAPEVRNAAMKKLFADPHFNVMDGLDIYIDDYTQPDPLPVSMLRQMASAQFMGLVEPEPETVDSPVVNVPKDPESGPEGDAEVAETGQDVAQSGVCTAIPSPLGAEPAGQEPKPGVPAPASHPEHDHAHLRLQPDDAAERPGLGHSAS